MNDLVKIAGFLGLVIAVVKIAESRTVCVYGPFGIKVCNR